MSRRSPGEGSVCKRRDGRWQAALQIGGKRQSVYARTRSKAVEKLRALMADVKTAGKQRSAGGPTLSQYLAMWLDQAAARLRPTTLADYRVIIFRHVVPQLGHLHLKLFSPLELMQYESALLKTMSKRRVRMIHDLLHKALGDAVRLELVAANVAAKVVPPKRTNEERALWDPEQARAFVDAMLEGQGGQYGSLFLFLLASSCRIGEALGLRWADVDWRAGTVKIERQLIELGGTLVEASPKTRSGVRSVVLPEFGIQSLRRLNPDTSRVFVTAKDTPPRRSNVRRAFNEVCRRLGLPRIRIHDLRHLSLSLLAMNGVPVKVAQVRAGHSNPHLTLRVYQHVLGDADRQAAEIMQKALVK